MVRRADEGHGETHAGRTPEMIPGMPPQGMPFVMPQLNQGAYPLPSGAPAMTVGMQPRPAADPKPGPKWTVHKSKDGRTFWYNSASGNSTWDKPDELKTDEEKLLASKTAWKEYTTADGRTFWYNRDTAESHWTLPDEVKEIKKQVEEKWPVFESKKEAKEKLRVLLEQKITNPRMKWDEAQKGLSADKRWSCFTILTSGEKKQCFAEFLTQLEKRSREQERKNRVKAREAIAEDLSQWEGVRLLTKQKDFTERFKKSWWWPHLEERERSEIFQEFMDEFERRYRDDRRRVRAERIEQLTQRFRNAPEVTIDTKWKEVVTLMKDDPLLLSVDRLDALIAWSEFAYQEDALFRDRIRAKTFRQMRKRRDTFRDLLQKCVDSGELTAKSKWPEWIAAHHEDSAYVDILGLSGCCAPRELWEHCRDALTDAYEAQKAAMKACIRGVEDMPITADLSFEEFAEKVSQNAEFLSIPEDKRRSIFVSTRNKIASRARKDAARRARSSSASPRLEPGEVDLHEDREEGQATSSDDSNKSPSRRKHKLSKREGRGERRSRRRTKDRTRRARSGSRSSSKARGSRSPRRGHEESHDSSGGDSDREKSKRRRR